MACLEKVRINTNRDMVQRMRLGGLFYVLCCSAIVLISPELRAQSYLPVFAILFVALAVARLVIYVYLFNLNRTVNQTLLEYAISAIYITTALTWGMFLT